MKRTSLLLLFLGLIYVNLLSQSCLPGGITFYNQEQIDNFQNNYPGCTNIEGNVAISGTDISDLSGLSMVDSIFGSLDIQICDQLLNLTGLNNLKYIGGSFGLNNNYGLINLIGLNNLTTIADEVYISGNLALTSLTGLENLYSVGALSIVFNESLTSLSGLEGMDSIYGDLDLMDNTLLPDFTGLEGLTSIGGKLWIERNSTLTSLAGLENIDPESISSIRICKNYNLSDCNIQSICDYLADPTGQISIYKNATGCNKPHEIAENCGITLSCLPFGNYYFFSQADIDSFPSYFPDCDQLEGLVEIRGEDITHLDSLSGVDTINGTLSICGNQHLSSLNGLHNVRTIQGSLWIGWIEYAGNDALTNLEGLNSLASVGDQMFISWNSGLLTFSGLDTLSSIGSDLTVWHNSSLKNLHGINDLVSAGSVYISENYSLLNLNGLQSLTNINGSISVIYNPEIFSIYGIANIDADQITYLDISNNDILSDCDVQSVCDYLASPGGTIKIMENATGCNNQEEVEEACEGLSVDQAAIQSSKFKVQIFPNPFSSHTTFNIELQEPAYVKLTIFNTLGQIIATILDESLDKGNYQVIWNAESFQPGIYFYRISNTGNRQSVAGKLVIY